ncbi:uncharacterized protein LOC113298015 isoform X3 [Papaver somniferum]|uniref:uncharacterized protein LOC113298015 isoform X3 n=1 Tax=Papaver somniferum TaxID=3469 RepID=UPI000E6F46AC|nr:uncharacterized protein LOC113298015 isoform X3 [Papaver somniferum]
MFSAVITSPPAQSSLLHFSCYPKFPVSILNNQFKRHPNLPPSFSVEKWKTLGFSTRKTSTVSDRRLSSICYYSGKEESNRNSPGKETEEKWKILKRWDVPWKWQTVFLTMVACGLSFVLTGLVEAALVPYLGLNIGELSLDEKAEILFLDQFIATAVVLGVLYALTNTFRPLPDDIFNRCSCSLTTVDWFFSTACLVGITGVLAPVLEETVFRGFLMVSLTKWFPTPVSIILTAAAFALAHLAPAEFPQLFVLGTALGFSYAQTRNLLTPITIHAIWNSGVILVLTFLVLQGYDIKELLQTS